MTSEPLMTIDYTVTEQDYRREMDFIIQKTASQTVGKRNYWWLLPLVAIAILLALTDIGRYLWLIVLILVLTAVCLSWRALMRLLLRKANEGSVKAARDAGDFDVPTRAVFYPDRFTVSNAVTHSVFPWDEISDVYETADGLYLVQQKARYLFLPSRYFDKESALAVTSLLQQTCGAVFRREAVMQVPETAASVGEALLPGAEEESQRYQFDFEMTDKDTAAVAGYQARRMLGGVALVFALLGGVFVCGSLRDGHTLRALYAAIVCAVIGATLVLSYRKAVRLRKGPSKNVSLRWYDDHVTAVTYQEDEAVNRIPYSKLRKIRRQGRLTVVTFKDNTFLYVPQTAFWDENQRTAWEVSLKEKL